MDSDVLVVGWDEFAQGSTRGEGREGKGWTADGSRGGDWAANWMVAGIEWSVLSLSVV